MRRKKCVNSNCNNWDIWGEDDFIEEKNGHCFLGLEHLAACAKRFNRPKSTPRMPRPDGATTKLGCCMQLDD